MAQMRSAIGGIPVQRVMLTDIKPLFLITDDYSLKRAIELTLAGSQKDFLVMDNGHMEGILNQTDMIDVSQE